MPSAKGALEFAPEPPGKLIGPPQLATLQIRRVIFHDIPRKRPGQAQAPTLSEIECTIDRSKIELLKGKLVRVLGSSAAYELEFDPETKSPLPSLITDLVAVNLTSTRFVTPSQEMAAALLERQPGSASAGLLALVSCIVSGRHGIALMKLEREEGAQLKLSEHGGKKTFEMSVLDDLVLTDGTKLFKSALFVHSGPAKEDVSVIACDGQRSYTWTDELAQFWMRFLGCRLREAPRITTKRFFDATLKYVNSEVDDGEPELKNDLYDHVVSQMKSQKAIFSPMKFIETYVPQQHRQPFRDFLQQQHVATKQFNLDTSEIKSHLKRRLLQTSAGVRITVPFEASDRVDVQKEQVIIADSVVSVGP